MTSTFAAVGVVLLMTAALVGFMIRAWSRLRRELSEARDVLHSGSLDAGSTNAFVRAVLEVRHGNVDWPKRLLGLLGERFPTVEPVDVVIERRLDLELESTQSLQLGGLITALGLGLTFLIIAILLADLSATTEVPGLDPKLLIPRLSATIREIGTKFYISAATVVAGAFHIAVASVIRWDLRGRARRFGESVHHRFMPLSTFEVLARIEHLAAEERGHELIQAVERAVLTASARQEEQVDRIDRALSSGRDEMSRRLEDVVEATRNLASIRVSVESMGTTVEHNLRGILKDSFGEELKVLVTEQKAHLEIIADKISETVATELQGSLSRLVEELRSRLGDGLAGIREALEGQSQNNLGELLARVENLAGQQVKTESDQLKAVLVRLNDLLPGLDRSLNVMMDRVSEQIARQADAQAGFRDQFVETSRRAFAQMQASSSEELARIGAALAKVSGTLESLAARQVEEHHAAERALHESAQRRNEEMDAALDRFGEGSAAAFARALATMETQLERVALRLEEGAARSHERFEMVQGTVDVLAGQLDRINKSLAANLELANKLGERSKPLIDGSARVVEGMGQMLSNLARLNEATLAAVGELRRIGADSGKLSATIGAQLEQQAKLNDALHGFFPVLLDKFTASATATAKAATSTAAEVIEQARKAQQVNAQDLRGSVEELRDVVEAFVEHSRTKPRPSNPVK